MYDAGGLSGDGDARVSRRSGQMPGLDLSLESSCEEGVRADDIFSCENLPWRTT